MRFLSRLFTEGLRARVELFQTHGTSTYWRVINWGNYSELNVSQCPNKKDTPSEERILANIHSEKLTSSTNPIDSARFE